MNLHNLMGERCFLRFDVDNTIVVPRNERYVPIRADNRSEAGTAHRVGVHFLDYRTAGADIPEDRI